MESRLPAHLEVAAMIRQVQGLGGFAMVLHKGETDGGTILAVLLENHGFGQELGHLYERLPQLDGTRKWTLTRSQDPDNKPDFNDYLDRRVRQDPDLWILELTVADAERLVLNGG